MPDASRIEASLATANAFAAFRRPTAPIALASTATTERIRSPVAVRQVCLRCRRRAAAQLDKPARRGGGTTGSLGLCCKTAPRVSASAREGDDGRSALVSPESVNAIGVDASIPMAVARCCVTTSFGALGLHSTANSCNRWLSRLSTGNANSTSPGALTRIGLRACSSPTARLTLRYSLLPNRAELAGDVRGAHLQRPSFTGRARRTPKVLISFRHKSDGFLGSSGR